jgi:RNA polymerase sigma factor (sigma-70 family)
MTATRPPEAQGPAVAPRRSRPERDALALAHLHLVAEVARQLRIRPSAAAGVDDYEGAGALALLVAAERWEPERGGFPAFATTCIANAMRRLGRDSRWRKTCTPRGDRRLVSLSTPIGRDPGLTVLDILADEEHHPGDELNRELNRELDRKAHQMQVLTVLSHLPADDRSLLHARYISGFREDVTAALLGLTAGQARWRLKGAKTRFATAWLAATVDHPHAPPSSRSIA